VYVRNSDPGDGVDLVCFAATPSPADELLSLDDLFCRKFAVDSQRKGRMVLVQPQSTVEVDSESDDTTPAREARSERGGATASTLSLNDILDDDTGSSDPSTPDGCDNLSVSDYEQLVIEGCPTMLADNSSLLPPPPLSLLRNGDSPSSRAKCVFIPVVEDSSPPDSDYTNLADDEAAASGLENAPTSCASTSRQNSMPAVSCMPLNGTDENDVKTSQHALFDKTRSYSAGIQNGVHRPTVLLTRRRKRASLAASAIVRSIQRNSECQFTNHSSDSQPFTQSNGCSPGTVLLYKDCLNGSGTGSSDDCPSLESLDPPGFRSSDGGDTVVCKKPFSCQDDGYCTAKSNVAVQLACCKQLSKITSSSEVDLSADGVLLLNSSEVNDFKSCSALPDHCTNSHIEQSEVFDWPVVSRLRPKNSRTHSDMLLIDVADSSDPETNVGDVCPEHCSSQSSVRSCQCGVSLGNVTIEACRWPLESVENHTDGPVGCRRFVGHEVDGDVQQAIAMFAFLDDQESSQNAASNSG